MRTAISIILNGMHHLPQQSKIIPLLFDKWIIVEGASKSNLCTSWCNDMPEEFHNNGSSVDGTVAFLKRLEEEQDNVEVYFASGLWGGKVSMFNYGIQNSNPEDGHLWEIDIDEYWEHNQINNSEKLLKNTQHSCAKFSCNLPLNEEIIVRGAWGESTVEGYKRLWKYKKGSRFLSHEPPCLENEGNCLPPNLTPRFTHLSYYYEDQVKFKAKWYRGHEYIYEGWKEIITGKVQLPCGVDRLFKKPIMNSNWENTIITYI
tara:strand:+ start:2036 stop:2815 length:780 start_codon:yes stop_codon:yes gene_type:complete